MEIFDFNHIRQLLLDHSQEGQTERDNICQKAAFAKGLFGIGMLATGLLGIICLVSAITYPFFGSIGFFILAVATLVNRELFVISGNVENTLSNQGLLGNIVARGMSAISPDFFVDSILQNTWLISPIFRSSLVNSLAT